MATTVPLEHTGPCRHVSFPRATRGDVTACGPPGYRQQRHNASPSGTRSGGERAEAACRRPPHVGGGNKTTKKFQFLSPPLLRPPQQRQLIRNALDDLSIKRCRDTLHYAYTRRRRARRPYSGAPVCASFAARGNCSSAP